MTGTWPHSAIGWAALLYACLSVLTVGNLARQWWNGAVPPESGHHGEQLPRVMSGRYAMMALLVAVFAVLGDWLALTIVFGCFFVISLIDVHIYRGAGRETGSHLRAAVFSAVGVVVCGLAWIGG